MNPFSVFKSLALWGFLVAAGNAYANPNLLVYVFKDGLVQSDISVVVADIEQLTDRYGKAEFELEPGSYQIGYFRNGERFAATELSVVDDIQSQVFLRLTQSGVDAELDLPYSELGQRFETESVKPLNEGPKYPLNFQINNASNDQPIEGAKVYFKGYDLEAVSDAQGQATVDAPAGEYDVSIVHPKFVMSVRRGVEVTPDGDNQLKIMLTQADFVMEEYVVNAPFVEGGLASAISAMKDSDVIGDALSSEQFTKSGDSTVADALKRVTGVTIVNDKYVYIRGLGERYTSILLNEMVVPSPEPTKRVVPLDIFPTGVIQDMTIQKTYSADLPGTFAGGAVLLNSKDIPEEDNYISAKIGVKFNDSTGDDALVGPDNAEPLPDIILNKSENFGVLTQEQVFGGTVIAPGLTAAEKDELNKAMMTYRQYGVEEQTIEPGIDVSLSSGQSFKTSGGLKYGFAGTVYYKTEQEAVDVETDRYQKVLATGETVHINSFDATEVTLNEKVGALVSMGLDDTEQHSAKYTLLWLNETTDTTLFGEEEELVEDNYNEKTYLSYVEEEVITHQLNGTSRFLQDSLPFFDELTVDWGLETATANRLEPGTFEYDYKQEPVGLVLDAKSMFYLYSDLEDNADNQRVDFTLPFTFNGQQNFTQFGYFNLDKERNLDNRRFKVEYQDTLDPSPIDEALTLANVNNGTADILDSYKPDDFYTAEQNVSAFYINQLISPLAQLDINLGIRVEDSTQSLRVGQEEERYELDTSDTLPALVGTYRLTDTQQVRFAYSETLSRPDFREFSPNRYKDTRTGYIVFGNPNLKYTTVENLDLKYEWYPSYNEYISVGAFSKDFTNPIETVRSQADVDIEITYRNAKEATSQGLEFGFRKNLDFFGAGLTNFYAEGNYTWIDTSVSLDKDNPEFANDPFVQGLTTTDRPLQGQSDYVINLQLGYDNLNTGRSAVLAYNEFGERIASLGINGNPDIYEQPFERLDFIVKWRLNDTFDEQVKKIGYTVSFEAENILDSDIVWTQGDEVTLKESVGRSYTLSFSAKY